jgi:hypothetical protein
MSTPDFRLTESRLEQIRDFGIVSHSAWLLTPASPRAREWAEAHFKGRDVGQRSGSWILALSDLVTAMRALPADFEVTVPPNPVKIMAAQGATAAA